MVVKDLTERGAKAPLSGDTATEELRVLERVIDEATVGVQVTAAATVQSAKRVQHTIEDVSTRMYEERDITELSKGEAFAILGLGAKGDYAAILRVAGEIDKAAVESTTLENTEDGTEIRRKNRDRAVALLNHSDYRIRNATRSVLAERIAQRKRLYGENEHFMRLTDTYEQRLNKDMGLENERLAPALREQVQQQINELLEISENDPSPINRLRMATIAQYLIRSIYEDTKYTSGDRLGVKASVDALEKYVNITKTEESVRQYLETAVTTRQGTEDAGILRQAINIYAAINYVRGDANPLSAKLAESARGENSNKATLMDGMFADSKKQLTRLGFELVFKVFEQSPPSINTADEAKEYILITLKEMLPYLTNTEMALLIDATNKAEFNKGLLNYKNSEQVRGAIETGVLYPQKSKFMSFRDGTTEHVLGIVDMMEQDALRTANDAIMTKMKEFLTGELKNTNEQVTQHLAELGEIRRNSLLFEILFKLTDAEKKVYAAVCEISNGTPFPNKLLSELKRMYSTRVGTSFSKINSLTTQLEDLYAGQEPQNPAIDIADNIRGIFSKATGARAKIGYIRGASGRTTNLQQLKQSFLELSPIDAQRATLVFANLHQLAKKAVLSESDRQEITFLLEELANMENKKYTSDKQRYTQELTEVSNQIATAVRATHLGEAKHTKQNIMDVTVDDLLNTRSGEFRFPMKYPSTDRPFIYTAKIDDNFNIKTIRDETGDRTRVQYIAETAYDNMSTAVQNFAEANAQAREPLYNQLNKLEKLIEGL